MVETTKQLVVRANDAAVLISFERHLKADGKSPHTLTHYLGATRQFLAFATAEGMPPVSKTTREHVEMWFESIRRSLAIASVLNRYLGLQQFFKWMAEEGEMRRNPMEKIKRPVLEETRKDIVGPEMMTKALRYLEGKRRWRDCAILSAFYDCGVRAGELAGAKLEHLDLTTGHLILPRTKNKRMRTVRLSPQAIRYFDRYLRRRQNSEWLITGRQGKVTANGLYQIVRAIFEEIGASVLIGPHDLRHTSASEVVGQMTESEMMALFGWQDPAMARHYARQALEKAALAAHQKASPLSRLKL